MATTKELIYYNSPGAYQHGRMCVRTGTKQLIYSDPPAGWYVCPTAQAVVACADAWNWMGYGAWDGFGWSGDGRIVAIDDAIYYCRGLGWQPWTANNSLARYAYGHKMEPYNIISPSGVVHHYAWYGVGAIRCTLPHRVAADYTQFAVSLWGASCLNGQLASNNNPAGIWRNDQSFPNVFFSLDVKACPIFLTPSQVVGEAPTQYVFISINPASINDSSEAVGGTAKTWIQYVDSPPAQYPWQVAPIYGSMGWAARRVLPSTAAAWLRNNGEIWLFFNFRWVYPPNVQASDPRLIIFNNLLTARGEAYVA